MTDRMFTFDEIQRIYDAGRRRGSEEATAMDWGSAPTGGRFDECIDEVYDMVNQGRAWDDPDRVSWDTVAGWFRKQG